MDDHCTPRELQITGIAYLLGTRLVTPDGDAHFDEHSNAYVLNFIVKNDTGCYDLLPQDVSIRTEIPSSYPFTEPSFFLNDRAHWVFPHLSLSTGKVCLMESRATRNERLLYERTRDLVDWIRDAATNQLMPSGARYEIPDFALSGDQTGLMVRFDEDEDSCATWITSLANRGQATLSSACNFSGQFVLKWTDQSGSLIREGRFDSSAVESSRTTTAGWLMLSKLEFTQHRPPVTWSELETMAGDAGIDLRGLMKNAWNKHDSSMPSLLLVGARIPETVGQSQKEVHWQACVYPSMHDVKRKLKRSRKHQKSRDLWRQLEGDLFGKPETIGWIRSSNIAPGRIGARGLLPAAVRATTFGVIGCGAIGSQLAEKLVRGGCSSLVLVDGDVVEIGNLARHTLDSRFEFSGKARSMAHKLRCLSPYVDATAFSGTIQAAAQSDAARRPLATVNLIVNATAEEHLIEFIDKFAASETQAVVSVYIDNFARFGTVLYTPPGKSHWEQYQKFLVNIDSCEDDFPRDEYFETFGGNETYLREGVGCWHPTFPACGHEVESVVSLMFDAISSHLAESALEGLNVVFGRSLDPLSTSFTPIQLLWKEKL